MRYIPDPDAIPWREAFREVLGDLPGNAANLAGLRYREGLSQAEFGKAIGIDQSNISKMESGKRAIGVNVAKRIGATFNIDYRLFL